MMDVNIYHRVEVMEYIHGNYLNSMSNPDLSYTDPICKGDGSSLGEEE